MGDISQVPWKNKWGKFTVFPSIFPRKLSIRGKSCFSRTYLVHSGLVASFSDSQPPWKWGINNPACAHSLSPSRNQRMHAYLQHTSLMPSRIALCLALKKKPFLIEFYSQIRAHSPLALYAYCMCLATEIPSPKPGHVRTATTTTTPPSTKPNVTAAFIPSKKEERK